MKRTLSVFAALAIGLMSSAFVPSLKASEMDKRTIITISQPIAVQGTILPAGKYVLKVQESPSTANAIYVFNGDETQLITTVLAIHAVRQQPADNSAFSFYDSPAGEPAALHTWFYPGDDYGFEFVQPQQTIAVASSGALRAAKKTPVRSPQHTVAADPHTAGGN
jgi:hypothetical protein